MCLYPKLILNRKYLPTKKNNYRPPRLYDERLKYVAIGCGNCIECRKQKANEWRTRLNEELKKGANGYFVTLTFTNENLLKLREECKNIYDDNTCAILAVRRFLERWRKRTGTSVRHWLITELGHENTERIHLHGLIFTNRTLNNENLQEVWQYGDVFVGDYCNERTINYIVKYVTKIDNDHKGYIAKILASAGIGNNYDKDSMHMKHKYRGKDTIEYYTLPNGFKCALPIYYRNKMWNEQEREQLWLNKINEDRIFVRGIECKNISTEEGQENYLRLLKEQQENNIAMGYGDNSKEWKKRNYRTILKTLNCKKHEKTRKHNIN